jgi:hypothetical protein
LNAAGETGSRTGLVIVILLCTAAAAVVVVLYAADPAVSGVYPPCMFHALTGLHCPGCGATRAAHRLLHGDVAGALRMNVLFVLALPALGYEALRRAVARRGGRPLPAPPTRWVVWGGIGLILLFGVVRNLPFGFCRYLAPG